MGVPEADADTQLETVEERETAEEADAQPEAVEVRETEGDAEADRELEGEAEAEADDDAAQDGVCASARRPGAARRSKRARRVGAIPRAEAGGVAQGPGWRGAGGGGVGSWGVRRGRGEKGPVAPGVAPRASGCRGRAVCGGAHVNTQRRGDTQPGLP